jgi:hypothetical protein
MDACLELLIPNLKQSPDLLRRPQTFVWEGKEHKQGPDIHEWGQHVQAVIQQQVPPHILARLPPNLQRENWTYISVKGDGLDLLAAEVNGEETNSQGLTLESFLRSQLRQDESWVVVFEWQCDRIDEQVEVLSTDDVLQQLRQHLDWSSTVKGFLAVHHGLSL